jgi:ABC-type multidrug transport system ATPase subunit
MLAGRDIEKSYGSQFKLRQADFELNPGSVMMLLGRNGSGKSTLLNILALALAPDSGSVLVDALSGRAARAAVGFAPQEIALFEELSVGENLRCWCPLPAGAARRRGDELLERLDLTASRRKLLRNLSGGQKRRVNLAAALMGEPRYLLLDEPLAGADEESEGRILKLLADYARQGVGVLISGHQPRLLRGLADRALVLERGEPLFSGTAEDYFAGLMEREL